MSSNGINGSSKKLSARRRKPRPSKSDMSVLSTAKDWLVNNQIRMPLALLSALVFVHLLVPQPYTMKFFTLSHFNPTSGLYSKGPGDWPFVTTFVLFFTFLRASLMKFVFAPFFYRFARHPTRRTATRFAEQAWSVAYYTISFLVGLKIIVNSPYWGNMSEMWADYPQEESDGLFKGYYLVETAFWLQQILVLNIEERRKDFWQMFAHHLVTCTLIFMSYTYNVTRVGNVILCIMDFSDILLSLAKTLKYLDFQKPCDFTFFLFLISWPYTRHNLYVRILHSAWFDAPKIFHRDNQYKPGYQMTPPAGGGKWKQGFQWIPAEGYYMTPEVHFAFIVLLVLLQCILLMWFVMIIRLAYRVIKGAHAEDDRSDDEDEGDDEEVEEEEEDTTFGSIVNGDIPSKTATNGIGSNGIHRRKKAD